MTGNGQRLDKWLWCARMVKTRPLAAKIVALGQVRVNKSKVLKPSYELAPGDIVTLVVHGRVRVIRVAATAARRGQSAAARLLYDELDGSEAAAPASQNRLREP